MKKLAAVLGVAVVATLAGCRDPEYKGKVKPENEVKPVATETEVQKENVPPAPVVEKICTCAPGTKHTSPCKCGAPNCGCIVETKPVAPAPAPETTVYIVQRGDYLAKISSKYNVTIGAIKRLNGMKNDTIRIGQKLKLPGKIDVGVQKKPAVTAAAPKAGKNSAAKPVAKYEGATREYVVKNGDNLGTIAYGNGITIRQLKAMNNLTSDKLSINQKLKIPAEPVKKTVKGNGKTAVPPPTPGVKGDKIENQNVNVSTNTTPVTDDKALPQPNDKVEQGDVAPSPSASAGTESAPEVSTPAPELPTHIVKPNQDVVGVAVEYNVNPAEIRELNGLADDAEIKPGQKLRLPAEAAVQ